jgi:hypothetical protein
MSEEFEWDDAKAKTNLKKHKVDFNEAKTVFEDPFAKIFFDQDHSLDEAREIIIGCSHAQRLIVVSFTERAPSRTRIISARVATRQERRDYEENQDI